MRFVVVLDLADEDPTLLGPYVSKRAADAIGTGFIARWGGSYSVIPMYSSIGEYLRLTEGDHE